MSETKARVDAILEKVNLEWDNDNIVYPYVEDLVQKGSSDEEILKDILRYVSGSFQKERTTRIIEFNHIVNEALRGLHQLGCWSNLKNIAEHATELYLEVLKKEISRSPMLADLYEYQTVVNKLRGENVSPGNVYDVLLEIFTVVKNMQEDRVKLAR